MKSLQLFQKPMLVVCLFLLSFRSVSQGTEQWVKRYNGPANSDDDARSLAIDASGNVYVTGISFGSSGSSDYTTIKYDASGNELWVKEYNGPENSSDGAYDLAVDASGNVYVIGGIGSFSYATIKYDSAGNELWVKQYNSRFDKEFRLAVDDSGNLYVTGTSYNGDNIEEYATIKYDSAGNELWVKRYNSPGSLYNDAISLAVDASGNVHVTGRSDSSGTGSDYATIKYDTKGNELWVKRYNGLGNGYDVAYSIAVDASGNAYVTGTTATIKYDAAGNELWVKSSYGLSLAVDASGNVYVTGDSTRKYDADGNELWVRRYNGPGNFDFATSLAVDASGNVSVTGVSYSGDEFSTTDYATIKYDAVGNELWVKQYNGPANGDDYATSLAVDASGNVYVTGRSVGDGTSYDYATIKYVQTQTSVVSSFTLINADTDEAIRELKGGDTLNLASLSSLNLNIRANTNPATIGSVMFKLSGAESRTHTENIVPYALFADNNNGDYYSWTPSNGNYTLTATPYSAAKGKGDKGTLLTIHFTVIGTAVSSLILVDAETDQDIKTLQNGDFIDLASLPTDKLNIRAVVHPDTVGSVVFNLNNRYIVRENLAPYAIGGDIKGDYRAWTLPTGHHRLIATPYGGKYGRGKKGVAYKVTFTVVDMSTTTRAAKGQQKPIIDALQNIGHSLSATPNPFTDQTTIRFSVPTSGYTTVQVYDVNGMMADRLYQAWAEAGKTYQVSFDSKQLANGVYMLQVATNNHVQSCKLVLIR